MFICLEDNTTLEGESFGAPVDTDGEFVFNTGMVGYSEGFTDPSYKGQILVLTYPLVGNYGVPIQVKNYELRITNYETTSNAHNKNAKPTLEILNFPLESDRIQVSGLIVSEYCKEYSHPSALQSLGEWLKAEGVPAIEGIDTRALTEKLREKGTMLGRIITNDKLLITNDGLTKHTFKDPNARNLVAEVSCKEPIVYEPDNNITMKQCSNVLLYDCGVKLNIIRCLLKRGCRVIRVPWDYPFSTSYKLQATSYSIDGIVISNGPGDPAKCDKTIEQIKNQLVMSNSSFVIPILGICLGNQILALAAGAKTYKLKYGHRSQNQPVIDELRITNYATELTSPPKITAMQ